MVCWSAGQLATSTAWSNTVKFQWSGMANLWSISVLACHTSSPWSPSLASLSRVDKLQTLHCHFNPLTAKLLFFITLIWHQIIFLHFVTWHQNYFFHFSLLHPSYFWLSTFPPTVWFYFMKNVLVLCKSAVYRFLYRIKFSSWWWKQHLDSTNSTSYKNSWKQF